jgi:hypothetical protein
MTDSGLASTVAADSNDKVSLLLAGSVEDARGTVPAPYRWSGPGPRLKPPAGDRGNRLSDTSTEASSVEDAVGRNAPLENVRAALCACTQGTTAAITTNVEAASASHTP